VGARWNWLAACAGASSERPSHPPEGARSRALEFYEAPVRARWGHGGTGSPIPCRGIVREVEPPSGGPPPCPNRPWPPEGARSRALEFYEAPARARWGHGGTGSPIPCGGIVREALGLSRCHGRRGARRNRPPHNRERVKLYSVGQRPHSVVHPTAHGLQRGRATLRRPPAASRWLGLLHDGIEALFASTVKLSLIPSVTSQFRQATPLFRRAPRRSWPPERPSHPPDATARAPGGSESLRKILTMPPHGRRANSTVPPTVPSPCRHGRERAKPYSIGQHPYSVMHPAAHGLQRGRATLRRPPAASRRLGEPS